MNNPSTVSTTGPSVSAPVLAVRHLTKYFPCGTLGKSQQVHALEDASFELRPGQIIALVGESGSGKSTTARLIARLLPPTKGEIILHDQDVLKTEPRAVSLSYRSQVQMIFQDPFGSLNGVKTIGYHLERPLLLHRRIKDRRELQEKVHDLLAIVGLTPPAEMARKYPYQLSGGQRQRVAIARALAVDPKVILADEPISMLDVSIRMGVLNLLAQLKEERGLAYLYITHDIASARYLADQTIVMYAGYMVEGAASDELMQEPAHPYTQLLLSAVPNPHAHERRTIEARGEVPSLVDPPPGCPFAARCPQVKSICHEVMPGITHLNDHHWTRCHLYEGEGNWQRST